MILNEIQKFENPELYSIEGDYNYEEENDFQEVQFVCETEEKIFTAFLMVESGSMRLTGIEDIDGHLVPLNGYEKEKIEGILLRRHEYLRQKERTSRKSPSVKSFTDFKHPSIEKLRKTGEENKTKPNE